MKNIDNKQLSKYEQDANYVMELLESIHGEEAHKVDALQVDTLLFCKETLYDMMRMLHDKENYPLVYNATKDPKKAPVWYPSQHFKVFLEAKRAMETSVRLLGLNRDMAKTKIELSQKNKAPSVSKLEELRASIKAPKVNGSIGNIG